MRNQRFNIIIATVLGLGGLGSSGCTADVHDNTADVHDNDVDVDAKLDFNVDSDADSVKAGESVSVTMNATGVVLVAPDKDPSDADVDRAAFFQVFLDSTDHDPIVVTASASASVKIPEDTKEGDHKLICRLVKHDGSPTKQEKEISIKVSASASVNVAGSGGTMM
jgi:hypothetical protein